MHRLPSISVVVPTYQRRELVMSAVDSALAQTVAPAEVLVVDDGSTDGTVEALAERNLDRVRVLSQANRGPSSARNAAIREARGEVVAFLDSDNRWLPHHLALIVELFARHPAAILVGTRRDYRDLHETAADAAFGDMAEHLLLRRIGVGSLSSVAVRRDALLAVDGFDDDRRYAEDTDLFLRLALLGPMALVSASTVLLGEPPDSVRVEGERAGGYVDMPVWTADRVLAALERSDRADVAALQEAALARRSMGLAFVSLHRGDSVGEVRVHLADACRRAPELGTYATWMLGPLPVSFPDWTEPDTRLRVLVTLARAWPDSGSAAAADIGLAAMGEAARQRQWRLVVALGSGLMTVRSARQLAWRARQRVGRTGRDPGQRPKPSLP